jgi:nucleotide-binding universal stress UspA family protein
MAVIAAIDLGPSSGRVLYHAAAFARLLDRPLKILHVTPEVSPDAYQHVLDFCLRQGPYEIDFDDPDVAQVVLRSGRVSEAIVREAHKAHAPLIVMGERGHGAIARILLGSTSEAVLRSASAPVLLVPPIGINIVNLSDRTALTCGPVLAAVDLGDDSPQQLQMASEMAQLSGEPLLLMTVATKALTEDEASKMLFVRCHGLTPVKPRAVIVRRGKVVDEISLCAKAEGAGLVVMGLRSKPRGQPGSIASAVLKTKRAFVLAVPGC